MSKIKKRGDVEALFASNAAKAAHRKSMDQTKILTNVTNTPHDRKRDNNQIDQIVESVTNATKRLSHHSENSSSSKRKVENKVGPWRLGRTLGKGSTGRVRLAKHSQTGNLAAIKIVPKILKKSTIGKKKSKIDDNGLPYGIEREIIIMKLISHPNIMGLYDVWENDDELYLVLEYVEGGELFDFLIHNGKLNEKDAVKYFRMIINGVVYCHKFNICHRDLKPENILLDKNGNIKIADFGMAALETEQKLLETSCGSPHYASPEIVTGKNYHGSPSDIWSCGIILFALLTGHLPFDDPSIRKLLLKVQTGKFHMPSNLSNEAKDLIWSMLRVDPTQRIKIEEVLKHPLLMKYPDENPTNITNNFDSVDFSHPVSHIDPYILHNLQTLWHGLPKEQIVKMLQNDSKNPEKMFYYLLKNYKSTHNPLVRNSFNSKSTYTPSRTNIPRSTSIIKTIIQDADGTILKSSVKKIKPSTSVSTNHRRKENFDKRQIIASSSKKSVSFKNLRKDISTSSLSLINMQQQFTIHQDTSRKNLNKYILENQSFDIIDSKIPFKKESAPEITVNPKDLPALPNLEDFDYLLNYTFDNDLQKNSLVQKENLIKSGTTKMDIKAVSKLDPKLNISKEKITTQAVFDKLGVRLSKLDMLKQELSSRREINSQLTSISSSSTRKLSNYVDKNYDGYKLKEFNTDMRSHKLPINLQINTKVSNNTIKSLNSSYYKDFDLSYSLHSAVPVILSTPTEKIHQISNETETVSETSNNYTYLDAQSMGKNRTEPINKTNHENLENLNSPSAFKLNDSGDSMPTNHSPFSLSDTYATAPSSPGTFGTQLLNVSKISFDDDKTLPPTNISSILTSQNTKDNNKVFPQSNLKDRLLVERGSSSNSNSSTAIKSGVRNITATFRNSLIPSVNHNRTNNNEKIKLDYSDNKTKEKLITANNLEINKKGKNLFEKLFGFVKRQSNKRVNDNKLSIKNMNTKSKSRKLFSNEVWLESDNIMGIDLIRELKQSPETSKLVVISMKEELHHFIYELQDPKSKLYIKLEIMDKDGSEYGFGGCFVKINKIRGRTQPYQNWCSIFKNMIAYLERET